MTADLFQDVVHPQAWREDLCPGAAILRGFAIPREAAIFEALPDITMNAPFRHLITPGGFRMSVAMTNCGTRGWVSDNTGYRYDAIDPESGEPWPRMPPVFMKLAQDAAVSVGFKNFEPDACLINRYEPGSRLTLHQDKNERGFDAPIVSVSLGIPAVFLWGGLRRNDKPERLGLVHGDVMVWGGPARLRYHGVLPLKQGYHPLTGAYRINLTFRKAV
jgi:alkylated DNA repair protein (DNA oxidative demethylase)